MSWDPSNITAWVYDLGPCLIQTLESPIHVCHTALGRKENPPASPLPRQWVPGWEWMGMPQLGGPQKVTFQSHDASAHWIAMGQLCPRLGLGSWCLYIKGIFLNLVLYATSCHSLTTFPCGKLWVLIGSHSSLSGTVHQPYCLWVGMLWMCAHIYVAAKG